jgi:hypothetical protein
MCYNLIISQKILYNQNFFKIAENQDILGTFLLSPYNLSLLSQKLTIINLSKKLYNLSKKLSTCSLKISLIHLFCFISNDPTSLFILSVAYKPLLIKQNEYSLLIFLYTLTR